MTLTMLLPAELNEDINNNTQYHIHCCCTDLEGEEETDIYNSWRSGGTQGRSLPLSARQRPCATRRVPLPAAARRQTAVTRQAPRDARRVVSTRGGGDGNTNILDD